MNPQLRSVLHYLEKNDLKLVTAESCTAGLIASTLAEEPGSGSWLDSAYVTYSVAAKIRCLQVRQETIDRCNLTSEAVAREMAEGALRQSEANVALATTGLAGPGKQDGIPAGTICFAWAFARGHGMHVFSETKRFKGERNEVRQASADYAISRIWHYHQELLQKQQASQSAMTRPAITVYEDPA